MLKIRDLGINAIPATMRPPEIGMGGGYEMSDPCGTSIVPPPGPDCRPSGRPACPAPSRKPKPNKGFEAGGLAPEAVSALRQQLQNQIG